MPGVAFNKFDCFVADVANGKHNLGSDALLVYLTNAAPVVGNTVYNTPADLGSGGGTRPGEIRQTSRQALRRRGCTS